MFHLGYGYLCGGWDLRVDYSVAAEWFKKAAFRGSGAGMAFYAYRLKFGLSLKQDTKKSEIWGQKALLSNDRFGAAYCHLCGLSTKINREEAFRMFESLAEEGDEYGSYWTGWCFHNGDGVEKDYEKAFYWYLKSAEKGMSESQVAVGCMLRDGKGCERDNQLSEVWFSKASKQNCYSRDLETEK